MTAPTLHDQAAAWIAHWEAAGGTVQWLYAIDGVGVAGGTVWLGSPFPQTEQLQQLGGLLTGSLRPAVIKRLRERLRPDGE